MLRCLVQSRHNCRGWSIRKFTMESSPMSMFDHRTKVQQKNVAAKADNHHIYDYLRNEVAEQIADRVADILRFFPVALDLGAGKGYIAKHLTKEEVGKLYQLESSQQMLEHCEESSLVTENVVANEEMLPFEENTFDLVMSCLSMHWLNDLPGVLVQINRCLKEDGVFLGAMFGSDTLYELRCSLQLAELEREGGFGPHISPFAEMKDVSSLLQRANMNLTTIDLDEIVVDYPSMFELMQDLKGMGENNATWKRKSILHRDTLMAAASIYKEMYGNNSDGVPATFQVIFMIGWKPSTSQAKPLQRGTATVNFKHLTDITSAEKSKEPSGD